MNTKRRMTGADALVLGVIAAIVAAAALAGCRTAMSLTGDVSQVSDGSAAVVAQDQGHAGSTGTVSGAHSMIPTRTVTLDREIGSLPSKPPMPTPYGGQ